jgi:hypothetical protein
VADVDIRCPAGPRNRFARVVGGVWEIACPNCRRTLRAIGADVDLVVHRYTPEGELIDTLTIFQGEVRRNT